MFGKLLKYDFRSMFKQFAFIWPAALALALVNHFTINSFVTSSTAVGETTAGIAMLVYVAILIAMFIIALVFACQRFYKGLLGDEGYLMFTLPVKPWQLIGSKLLCAVITTFLSVVVALLSVLLLLPWEKDVIQGIFEGIRFIFTHWNIQATHGFIGFLEFCLMIMMSFAVGYLQIYLSLGIGHLFNKHRALMTGVAFIAINAVVTSLLGRFLGPAFDMITENINNITNAAARFHSAMWIAIASELVLCAIYFAGTEFILRNKLNLE